MDLISAQSVAEAEKLLGVEYTPTQRDMIAASIRPQIELAQARRKLSFLETLAPAGSFDPRLPGWEPPPVGPFKPTPLSPQPLPEDDTAIAFAPIGCLAGWIRRGELSSVRLTRIFLDRIERLAPPLACIAALDAAAALAGAEAADRMLAAGDYRGPLHGLPWGAKDLLDTAGLETAWGAEPWRGRVPPADCTVVARLKSAGAVLIAKTAVGALAYGDIWYGGKCLNPWNTDEGSSGSSAGSASAMAAGLMAFAIGTETAGSLVSPAMRCGNATLRPTFGRVSRAGIMPLAWSLDKVGPICRRVDDLALTLDAINGFDQTDPGSIAAPFGYDPERPVEGLKIGYFAEDFAAEGVPDLDRAAVAAVGDLGMVSVPLERPDLPYLSLRSILFAEAAAAFEALSASGRDAELTRQDADAWPNEFRKARFLSAVDYVQLQRFRRQVMELADEWFRKVDLIIGPSMVGPMLTLTNFTGHPSVVIRTGFIDSPARDIGRAGSVPPPLQTGAVRRVPHGISLWGRLFDEGTILTAARALEQHFNVWDLRPPGFGGS